jgi:catabolite regulation protein CreA
MTASHSINVGDKFRVNKDVSGNYKKGSVIKVLQYGGGETIYVNNLTNPKVPTSTMYVSDLDPFEITLEDLEKEIEDLQVILREKTEKVTWMKAVKTDSFNEKEYAAWKAIQVIKDSNLSDINKAKLLVDILKF